MPRRAAPCLPISQLSIGSTSPRRCLPRTVLRPGRDPTSLPPARWPPPRPAGFAGACVLEYLWGGEAPLAHLGLIQPGTQLTSAPWWVGGLVLLFLANGLGLFSALGDRSRDDDAY